MNKEQLVEAIAKKTKMAKKDVNLFLNATLDAVTAALKKNDKVTLVGFGTFQVRERAAREGRNPRTGAVLKIKSKKAPVFTPGKGLKEVVQPTKTKAAKK